MRRRLSFGSASLAVILLGTTATAQQPAPSEPVSLGTSPSPAANQNPQTPNTSTTVKSESKPVKSRDRRRAANLYLQGSKLFKDEKFEPAMHDYEQAAALDPTNSRLLSRRSDRAEPRGNRSHSKGGQGPHAR